MFDGPARKHFSSYVSIAFELIHSKQVTYFLMKRFKCQVLALSFFFKLWVCFSKYFVLNTQCHLIILIVLLNEPIFIIGGGGGYNVAGSFVQ